MLKNYFKSIVDVFSICFKVLESYSLLVADLDKNVCALFPQQADLISLGKVVLALACNSLAGIQRENLQKAMELVTINYSSDLKNLIL